MRFTLTIDCDNAAFCDVTSTDAKHDPSGDRDAEVSRILAALATRMEQTGAYDPVILRDFNGNVVGEAKYVRSQAKSLVDVLTVHELRTLAAIYRGD